MNICDYLLENGDTDGLALVVDNNQYTYADLRAATARLLETLMELGVQPGQHVGLLGANSLFWVAAYLATLKLGAVTVPYSTLSMPDEIKVMNDFAATAAVFAQRKLLPKFGAALSGARLVTDEALDVAPLRPWSAYPADPGFESDREAALMFTSGTTQKPRAVRISHRNIRANTESIIEYLGLTRDERIMDILPFFYCFGTSLLHTHLRVGGSLVIASSFAFPEAVLDQMEKYACTGFAGVPSNFQTLIRNTSLSRRSLPTLRKIQQAGGKLPAVQIAELRQMLPGAQIFIMYGQTEATARLSYLSPDLLDSKLGSIGKGIPGVTLRVMSEAGQPVQPGETGEIWARGENISAGYFQDPVASAEKFIDGELRTGDLATVDEDGFIFVVDRKADFIKSFGYRVSSQQIEACVLEVKDVVSAAAIGEPDPLRGEAIKVFVTLSAGSAITPADIIAYCRQKLARHMLPKEVVVLDALPLSPQGKVLKSELRKLSAATAAVVPTTNPTRPE